jgi:hypothetical protein
MAYDYVLNRDKGRTGGVIDAPDPVVRSAMSKLLNPQGSMPMTQKELSRLMNRQYLEQENARASNTTSQQTAAIRAAIASGEMAPINVNQYAGSMFAPQGAYNQARPLAPQRGFNYEKAADALLKKDFGTMYPGQEMRIAGIPDEMLVPAGQAEAVQALPQATVAAPKATSVIEQLIGRSLNVMQGGGQPAPQQMGAFPTVGEVMNMTPAAQQRRLEQQKFAAEQATAARKQLVTTLSSMAALGVDISGYDVPPDIMSEAKAEGDKQALAFQRTFPSMKKTVEGGVVYEQAIDPTTGEPVGDRIPTRSTQELPGTPKPQSTGQLIPAINPQTGREIEGVYFDPTTKEYRNVGIPGIAKAVAAELGFGAGTGGGTSTPQPTPKPVPQPQEAVLPKPEPAKFAPVKGQRYYQGGKTYEYDGSTYNLVK